MSGDWWPYLRGVPAAGHITRRGGYWHPGNGATCARCNPKTERRKDGTA
jgi:hypothetical protein